MKAILFVISFTVSVMGCAQEANSTMAGRVFDEESRSGISGAKILIYQEGKLISTSESDSSGGYKIPLLTPGVYTTIVKWDGYSEIRVNDIVLSPNKITFLDFALVKSVVTPQKKKKKHKK